VGWLTIRNKGAASNTITIIKDISATDYEKAEFTLGAGEEWVNPFNAELTGTGMTLEITTSSTSAVDVDCSFTERIA